ncbi:hypothetical protein FBQ82_03175 [Anaerolineae bacterium CFX7]|nr:hypothetical protein [Anaerolineae bacterium CFX7]
MKHSHFSLRQVLARAAVVTILFCAALGLNGSLAASPAAAADLLAVHNFLNADGTLNLAAQPHGTFDLSGWNVKLDAVRGPVLDPVGSDAQAPSAVGDWSALGSNGAGDGSLNNQVWALAVSGSEVYVGGSFTNVNNNGTALGAADHIAKWDGTNWSALGSNGAGDGSLNSNVFALAVIGNDLYVGGSFTNVNNNGTVLDTADYIAKWDGTNWSPLGSNGHGNGSLNYTVRALAVSGNDLYVGGWFWNVNSGAADYIAKWNGTNWSALGSNYWGNGSINNRVYALAVSGSDLYVGGLFTNVDNNGTVLDAADYIVKWDGANWSALGSNGAGDGAIGGSRKNVTALAVRGSDLYVGGDFTDVNNNGTVLGAADYIAKWDGTNWSALGSNGAGDGALYHIESVYALAMSGSDLYVGGSFTNVNNNGTVLNEADKIAKWDGTNWSALGSNGAGDGQLNPGGYVYALAVSGSDLYVGGRFENVNNNGTVLGAGDHVAKYQFAEPPSSADLAAALKVKKVSTTLHRYKVTITNLGADAAESITILDKLPKGYTISKVKSKTASCTTQGRRVTCTAAQLAVNGRIVVKIIAIPNNVKKQNCVTVSAVTLDPQLSNNKACVAAP